LDAHFLGRYNEQDGSYYRDVPFESAQGVSFQCPRCAEGLQRTETYIVGDHSIICWFYGKVPDNILPGPGRWIPSGTSLLDLTLNPSVSLEKSCGFHGWVTSGEVK
jgi:hypothetical protein